jgi:hypothetical protein
LIDLSRWGKVRVRLVRDADPDVLAGWEVQQASWGYLMARAAALGTNLCPLLARVPGSARESMVVGEVGEAGAGDPALQHQVATTSATTSNKRKPMTVSCPGPLLQDRKEEFFSLQNVIWKC